MTSAVVTSGDSFACAWNREGVTGISVTRVVEREAQVHLATVAEDTSMAATTSVLLVCTSSQDCTMRLTALVPALAPYATGSTSSASAAGTGLFTGHGHGDGHGDGDDGGGLSLGRR